MSIAIGHHKKIINMKNLFYAFIICFALFGCDEIPPDIGGEGVDVVDPTEVANKVLIEEFTGVRCVNCPAGSEAIEQLLDIHGERLIAVSIHAGFFSIPYDESKYDFSTDAGDGILALLGSPVGYPTGVVDRFVFDGEDDLQIGKTKWAGTIEQRLAAPPTVKLDFSSSYNASTRKVDLDVTATYLQNLSIDAPRLTIYLVENGIKDYQDTPEGKQSDYEHKHVFRDAVTPFDGILLTNGLDINTVEEHSFSYTLPEAWDASKVNAIAFVHNGGVSQEVLQVEELHVAQ